MKTKNVLFKGLYDKVFYGGSYYDGLRVGHPEEFDLDLLLRLPKLVDVALSISNIPGFVHMQLTNFDAFQKQPVANEKYWYEPVLSVLLQKFKKLNLKQLKKTVG